VRYQLTLDSGVNPLTGKRQQVRRRYATEKQARDALSDIGQQAATDQFVPRKAVTVEELCADWLASLHNARATTLSGYAYVLAPLREQRSIPVDCASFAAYKESPGLIRDSKFATARD
jgi:hypothetical protein